MRYRIWSFEHKAWWKPNEHGYTPDYENAGIYQQINAIEICIRANHHSDVNEAMVPVEEE